MWPTEPIPPGLPDAASPFKSKPTKTNSSDSHRFNVDDGTSSVSKLHAPVQLSHLASLGVEEIHKLLESDQDTGPTLGNVTLEVYPWKEFDDKKKVFDGPPTSLNICEHTGKIFKYDRLYFGPAYEMDENNWTQGFENSALYKHILQKGIDGRNPLISNGGGVDKRKIVCKGFYRKERKAVAAKKSDKSIVYRGVQAVNDRKLSRPAGKSMPRKSSNADTSSGSCKFMFYIKCDEIGPYINLERNAGCGDHNNHPLAISSECIPVPLKLVPEEVKKTAVNVVESAASHAAGRNFLLRDSQIFINKARMAYLAKLSDEEKNSDSKMGDFGRMIDQFEREEDISYTILSNVPLSDLKDLSKDAASELDGDGQNKNVTVATTKGDDGNITCKEVSSEDEIAHADNIAKEQRQERALDVTQILFMAIGFVYLPLLRFVKLCPEVIWCDITSHSNNKGFHLMTFSCRNSGLAKQSVFMWLWLPDQKRFSFRWVFQHALKMLLPLHVRLRVRFIMKDGDPQQRNEILRSLLSVFPNAIEGSCGWHIVDRGWHSHIRACIAKAYRPHWNKIVKKIHTWIYSWMKPGFVEDPDEYEISKALLIRFICSDVVLRAARNNKALIIDILKFVRSHVFVYEQQYLFYLRKRVKHYAVAHGTQHEGTNTALKEHSAGIKGTMNMDIAAKTIILQSKLKVEELNAMIYRDFSRSDKPWSISPTSKHLLSFAEALLKAVRERTCLYTARRVDKRIFEVSFTPQQAKHAPASTAESSQSKACSVQLKSDEIDKQVTAGDLATTKPRLLVEYADSDDAKVAPLPLFERKRIVTVADDGTLSCECCKFEFSSLPCEHLESVCHLVHEANGSKFAGWTPRDIGVKYHTLFNYYTYRPSDQVPERTQSLYHRLACQDISGPNLRCEIPDSLRIDEPSPKKTALDRLKNYSKDDVDLNQFDGLLAKTFKSSSTQLTEDEECDMFTELTESLCTMSTDHANDVFSSSLEDADLPTSASASTYSALKQSIFECCEMADRTGMREAFHEKLKDFMKECNSEECKRKAALQEGKPAKKLATTGVVAMTNVKHSGPGRVHNTKTMPK